MKTIVDRNIERLPARAQFAKSSGFGGFAVNLRDQLVGDVRGPLLILQAGVILVLLIACANVANLLLMRATGRGRELAIRTTLGAGHWRLVRQMLTEGLVLSAIGALGGLALGIAGVRGLIAMSSRQLPAAADASLQPAVLLFTMALALVTGLRVRRDSRRGGDPRKYRRLSEGRQHARIRRARAPGDCAPPWSSAKSPSR